MKNASGVLVVALVWLVAAMAPNVGATNYTVGDSSPGWTTDYNYATWTADKTFVIGDNLFFKYNQQVHDVVEVTSANYDSCISTNSISQAQTGNDIIALTTEGTRYFICSIGSHCSRQMKISITTTAGTTTPSPPSTTPTTTPPPPPAPTTTPTPPSTITPPTATTPSTTPAPPPPPPTTTTTTPLSPPPPTSPGTRTPPSPSDASLSLLPKVLTPLFFALSSLLLSFLSTL